MDVSIIIVNYNTLRITQECIDSIFKQTSGLDFEVIVVDNASTDGSDDILKQDKRIRYIQSPKNGGFGFGNNVGMRAAKGRYFLLLNSDTLLMNNAVKLFFDYAESHRQDMIYGGWLKGKDGQYRHSFFYFPAFTILQFMRRKIHPQNYRPTWNERDVECVCGADMFFPRTAFERTGGFDENIFLYGEEGEWQYRLKRLGFGRRLITGPKIVHLEGQSTQACQKLNKIRMKSHFYILHKWMCRPTYLMARLYYFVLLQILKRHS